MRPAGRQRCRGRQLVRREIKNKSKVHLRILLLLYRIQIILHLSTIAENHDRLAVFFSFLQQSVIAFSMRLVKAENTFVKGQAETLAAVSAHIVAHTTEIGQHPPRHAPKTAKRGKIELEDRIAV